MVQAPDAPSGAPEGSNGPSVNWSQSFTKLDNRGNVPTNHQASFYQVTSSEFGNSSYLTLTDQKVLINS